MGRMLNGMAVLAGCELQSERLAVALDTGDQEDEQSCFSDTTHAGLRRTISHGIENVWLGATDGATGTGPRRAGARSTELAADTDRCARSPTLRRQIDALGDPWDQVLGRRTGLSRSGRRRSRP